MITQKQNMNLEHSTETFRNNNSIPCCLNFGSLLIILMFAGLLATACFAKTIMVDGIGYTKETAINNALRNAVERVAGLQLGSTTLVKNHMVVSDKILTNTQGYIHSYKIIKSSHEFGLHHLTVSADVSTTKLKDDLIAQKLLYEIKNRPRIMVLLDERVEGREMFEKTATHVFENELIGRGYKIVEPEQLNKIKEIENARSMNNGDLASLAFRTGADLIIRGRISVGASTPRMVYGAQFYAVPIQLNARIVRADNAQILVSKTALTKKNSREEFTAAQFGLETGARALAKELMNELNEFWRSEAYNDNGVELIITGLNNLELRNAEKIIRTMGFVNDMKLRYFEKNSAVYDLKIAGTIQDLRFGLADNKQLKLSISSITANKLIVAGGQSKQPVRLVHNKPAVEITSFAIDDVFPSRVRNYDKNPLAKVTIRCNNHSADNLKIGIRIPGLMELPVENNIKIIKSGDEASIKMKLLLDRNKLLRTNTTRTMNGQVVVTFSQAGKLVRRKLSAPVKVYDKNAMDWTKPDAIGGFVAYKAEAVKKLSRQAVHAVSPDYIMNRELLNAMALYESMKLLGIKYVKDPVPSGTMLLDMVQYPSETLELLSGDCDDLAVLYTALLSSIGIRAAIIVYRDHVLVMFDSGVYQKNRTTLSADSSLSIIHNGKVWIPIETTLLGKGFIEAWHTAAEEFHTAIAEGQWVSIIDMRSAWMEYPPVALEAKAAEYKLKGLKYTVAKRYEQLQNAASFSITKAIRQLKNETTQKRKNNLTTYNRIGILSVRSGDYNTGLRYFEKAIKQKDTPEINSNYASALLLTGKGDEAQKLFDTIYKKDRTGRIAVNRALCSFFLADDSAGISRFISELNEAAMVMPEGRRLSEYIGVDLEKSDKLRASDEHVRQKKQTVNIRRLKALIKNRVLAPYKDKNGKISGTTNESSTGTKITGTSNETSTGQVVEKHVPGVMPFGGLRGADPEQIMKIIDLLYWFEN